MYLERVDGYKYPLSSCCRNAQFEQKGLINMYDGDEQYKLFERMENDIDQLKTNSLDVK